MVIFAHVRLGGLTPILMTLIKKLNVNNVIVFVTRVTTPQFIVKLVIKLLFEQKMVNASLIVLLAIKHITLTIMDIVDRTLKRH